MWLEETTARATCPLWSTTTMLPINGVSFPPTWATDAATQGCQLLTSHYDKRFWAAGLLSPVEGWSVTDRRWYKTESRCRQVLHLKAWLPHKHTHQALTSPSLQKVPFSPVINREAVRWPSIVCIKARTEYVWAVQVKIVPRVSAWQRSIWCQNCFSGLTLMHITPFKADQDWISLASVGLVTGLF